MRYWLPEIGKAMAIIATIAVAALWIHTVAGSYWVAWRGRDASYFVVSAPSGILLQRAVIHSDDPSRWQRGQDLKLFKLFTIDPDSIWMRLGLMTATSRVPTRHVELNDEWIWESRSVMTRNFVIPYWLLLAVFGIIPFIGPIRRRRRAMRQARHE